MCIALENKVLNLVLSSQGNIVFMIVLCVLYYFPFIFYIKLRQTLVYIYIYSYSGLKVCIMRGGRGGGLRDKDWALKKSHQRYNKEIELND